MGRAKSRRDGGTESRWKPRIHFRDVHGQRGMGGRDERTGRLRGWELIRGLTKEIR